jgi:hypothetical protein
MNAFARKVRAEKLAREAKELSIALGRSVYSRPVLLTLGMVETAEGNARKMAEQHRITRIWFKAQARYDRRRRNA